ncbi:MAG: hypothetical protein MSJ26_05595 [Oscillospiraceae bacterium]|nr:hypothetical protein [Oscillospiraceae bacterium]
MLINSVSLIANAYVKNYDIKEVLPEYPTGRGFMVFSVVTAVVWLISYVMFVFLK